MKEKKKKTEGMKGEEGWVERGRGVEGGDERQRAAPRPHCEQAAHPERTGRPGDGEV